MKLLLGLPIIGLLTACANTNQVARFIDDDSVVKYKNPSAEKLRFQNLYEVKLKDKTYPLTCEGDCYPSSPMLQCESKAENCMFIGENQQPNLNTGFEIQWLGHASFHIKMEDGTSLLIDPVTDQFDSPIGFANWLFGGKYRDEPSAWLSDAEIYSVDGILYSHIHYDHFNKADIDDMPRETDYFVPLGFAEHFEDDGYQINEMAWYATTKVNKSNIHFVPANHFSNRIWVPFIYEDQDTSLWGGWVIENQGNKIFFAGDTGYSKHFKDIHQRYGDMDICLMPIASYYHPESGDWYRYVHLTPEDALIAAADLKCKLMIPWGYGNNSWQMGDKSTHSPLLRLWHMHKQIDSKVPLYIFNEGEKQVF